MARVLVIVIALLAFPAAAGAATAKTVMVSGCGNDTACGKYGGLGPVPVVVFEAAPGEANRLVLKREGGDVLLHDDGAPVTAGEGCTAVDERTARCPFTPADLVNPLGATLSDGDDTLRVDGDLGDSVSLSGGPGADTIAGGLEADRLDGGPGSDNLDGGAGADSLDYTIFEGPVSVDLGAGRADSGSDSDTVADVETVTGGQADDVLIGSAEDETLNGGLGEDVVDGKGGNDLLAGGGGDDDVRGGAGDDEVFGDPEYDDVYGGAVEPGADRLFGGDGDDVLGDLGTADGDVLSGGAGDDRLSATAAATQRGGAGNDLLSGGSYSDRLDGGPGGDRLETGGGRDRVRAGRGKDRIAARDGARTRVDGGAGRDLVQADRRDRLVRCERRVRKLPFADGSSSGVRFLSVRPL